jgi:HAMP domain-containing protein
MALKRPPQDVEDRFREALNELGEANEAVARSYGATNAEAVMYRTRINIAIMESGAQAIDEIGAARARKNRTITGGWPKFTE